MYVRNAKNREEVWLLDHIEELELDDSAFRSRDYVVAVDEATHEKAGFGRIRVHRGAGDAVACELTSIGVLEAWRRQGVGAHIVERLVTRAGDDGFERVYALTERADYLAQFGFEPVAASELPGPLQDRLPAKRDGVAPDAVPMEVAVDGFEMPDRLRRRFKVATPAEPDPEDGAGDSAEDFGIDPDATTKYDTGK